MTGDRRARNLDAMFAIATFAPLRAESIAGPSLVGSGFALPHSISPFNYFFRLSFILFYL
jgi:hypothetical protein